MKKIIDYKTIWANGNCIDEDVVNDIKEGWQPLGGISHLWDEEDQTYSYCQAMVKYETCNQRESRVAMEQMHKLSEGAI